MQDILKGKKVILVGLGRLGGGVAAAKYIASRGAKLTVTDTLDRKTLASSIGKLRRFKNIQCKLGVQKESDFKGQDIAIFNPAVPIHSPLVQYARKHCKEVHNDLSYFLLEIGTRYPLRQDSSEASKAQGTKKYIGVTGTRGKTTVTTWIGHFLKPALVGGNMPDSGLFKLLMKLNSVNSKRPIVLELSSFQLEFMRRGLEAPHIAVITNVYQDHINRHKTFEKYLETKSLIFKYQKKNDILILNTDNPQTKKYVQRKPKARIFFVSLKKVKNGLYIQNKNIVFAKNGKRKTVGKVPSGYSAHMQYNLLTALLAAHMHSKDWKELMKSITTLPDIQFRQERILKKNGLEVYNDSASTSPEGAVAAIDRFKGPASAFIFGGTDKMLNLKPLAVAIKKNLKHSSVYLLQGSATEKLANELKKLGWKNIETYQKLEDIVRYIGVNKKRYKKVIFSPGAASFEKFKNEFDRGRKFNRLTKRYFV